MIDPLYLWVIRNMMVRLEEVEQEDFKCKEMVLRGVDANHQIISEVITEHKKETKELQEQVLLLCKEIASLQAQIHNISNQNCEYEVRFKRISDAASFRILETESSFVDGKPLPWKFDDKEEGGGSSKDYA